MTKQSKTKAKTVAVQVTGGAVGYKSVDFIRPKLAYKIPVKQYQNELFDAGIIGLSLMVSKSIKGTKLKDKAIKAVAVGAVFNAGVSLAKNLYNRYKGTKPITTDTIHNALPSVTKGGATGSQIQMDKRRYSDIANLNAPRLISTLPNDEQKQKEVKMNLAGATLLV